MLTILALIVGMSAVANIWAIVLVLSLWMMGRDDPVTNSHKNAPKSLKSASIEGLSGVSNGKAK